MQKKNCLAHLAGEGGGAMGYQNLYLHLSGMSLTLRAPWNKRKMGGGTNHAGSNVQGSLAEQQDTVWLRSTPVPVMIVINGILMIQKYLSGERHQICSDPA